MNLPVTIHLVAAVPALALGVPILVLKKGTPRHKVLGRTWAALTLVTAVSSFWIRTLNPGALFVDSPSGNLDYLRRGYGPCGGSAAAGSARSYGVDDWHVWGFIDRRRARVPTGSSVMENILWLILPLHRTLAADPPLRARWGGR